MSRFARDQVVKRFQLPAGSHSQQVCGYESHFQHVVAPEGIIVYGLGPQYQNDLFMGAATPLLQGGYLFHFDLTGNRRKIAVDDPRLQDRVADNNAKHEITESESLLIGRNFGVVTDVETAPNGYLIN